MPGANKAVKCREDGVTRYAAGYTVFFLCDKPFKYLRIFFVLFHYFFDFLFRRNINQTDCGKINIHLNTFTGMFLFRIMDFNSLYQLVYNLRSQLFHIGKFS